jgi:flagellar basal-body rod protein FlgF
MDALTSSAASGMRASLESLDMLANNLANTQTNGYKGDREFFDMYSSNEEPMNPVLMPDMTGNWTDFSQGSLQPTGNPLDLALAGQGFFAVNGPLGTLYTRNGALRLNAAGQLVTQDGYTVQGTTGRPIKLDPTQQISIDARGSITQGGVQVAQMQVSSFTNLTELSKQGLNYFQYTGQSADIKAAPGEVKQGSLEGSNVGSAESAVRLVTVMRQFEMLQKAISIGSDMNKQAMEEVARSGQ